MSSRRLRRQMRAASQHIERKMRDASRAANHRREREWRAVFERAGPETVRTLLFSAVVNRESLPSVLFRAGPKVNDVRAMRALIFGTAIGLIATSALAQQDNKFTAKYLLPYCRAAVNNQQPTLTSDAVVQGMCVGIVDALDFIMSELRPEDKDYRSCPPSDATLKETVEVVIAYIDARPERMNESFKKLAIEAIQDAWPCGTN